MIGFLSLYLISIAAFYFQMISGVVFVHLSFVSLIGIVAIDYAKNRRFTLFLIWQGAFIYMILADMIIMSFEQRLNFQDVKAMSFLSFANLMFSIGYLTFKTKKTNKKPKEYIIGTPKLLLFTIVVLYIVFAYYRLIDATRIFYFGRDMGDSLGSGSILETFLLATGYILPSLIGFYAIHYFPQKKWYSLLFVFPLFLIGIVLGARFKLLYMVIPYLVIMDVFSVKRVSKKNIIIILISVVLLASLSSLTKVFRVQGLYSSGFTSINSNEKESTSLLYNIAQEMSPEGVVRMTKYGNIYFDDENHSYLYGVNSTFILYIWIPRSIWPNKPTPLDYWMIRKYENVSDTASTASGFIGDFRADFGYFSLIIILLIGIQFKRLDGYLYRLSYTSSGNLLKLLTGFCFSWVFFFVRSPITSTTSFMIAIAFLAVLIKINASRKKTTRNTI